MCIREEFEEARTSLEEVVRIDRRLFGDADVVTVADRVELAATVTEAEGYAAAAGLHREALEHRGVLDGHEGMTVAFAVKRFGRLARESAEPVERERDR